MVEELKKQIGEIKQNIKEIEKIVESSKDASKEFYETINEILRILEKARNEWDSVFDCLNNDCKVKLAEDDRAIYVYFTSPTRDGYSLFEIKREDLVNVFNHTRNKIAKEFTDYLKYTSAIIMRTLKSLYYNIDNVVYEQKKINDKIASLVKRIDDLESEIDSLKKENSDDC
ncbi:MAG: hypothetical protein QXQ91_03420 [Nanopusillaceae archaeon]